MLKQRVSGCLPLRRTFLTDAFITRTSTDVLLAQHRLKQSQLLYHTPVMESYALNRFLDGHRIFFKCENLQRTGAFKARGALNTVLSLLENKEKRPKRIVAFSSGNHAGAVAWACNKVQLKCTIFMPLNVSPLKAQACRFYGADVILCNTRPDAEYMTLKAIEAGHTLIHPFNQDSVLCGQGTACLEAMQDLIYDKHVLPDAVFAPVGGGGLISGTSLAAAAFSSLYSNSNNEHQHQRPLVYGAEPLNGNDACQSLRKGSIVSFMLEYGYIRFIYQYTMPYSTQVSLDAQPITMADGAMTMSVSERTFSYLKNNTDGIYEINETEISYYTQWLTHLLKMTIEPTSAMACVAAMLDQGYIRFIYQYIVPYSTQVAAVKWLQGMVDTNTNTNTNTYTNANTKAKKSCLVILSGGNIASDMRHRIWQTDQMHTVPSLKA